MLPPQSIAPAIAQGATEVPDQQIEIRGQDRSPTMQVGVQKLGVVLDAVGVGEHGVRWGFNIARAATNFGFGAASAAIKMGAQGAEAAAGPSNPVSAALRGVGSVVGVAHAATRFGQEFAHLATATSLSVAKAGLVAAGAKEGESLRLAIGEEAAEAVLVVLSMVRRFTGPLAAVPVHRLMLATLAWYRTQRAALTAQQALKQSEPADLPPGVDRWMRFAAATFGPAWLAGLIEGASLAPVARARAAANAGGGIAEQALASAGVDGQVEILLFEQHPEEMFSPGFLVGVDYSTAHVVVALRGTSSTRDILADLVCEPTPIVLGGMDGYAHGGMLRAAQRLSTRLDAVVEEGLQKLTQQAESRQDTGRNNANRQAVRPRLMICGHSLGAGVAALLTALWRDDGRFPGVDVQCMAFACPQILNADLALALSNHTTSFVHGDDVVPRLSLATVEDFRDALLRLLDPASFGLPSCHGAEELLRVSAQQDDDSQCVLAVSHAVVRDNGARSDHGRLFPAGRIVLLPTSSGEAQTGSHYDVDELLICADMGSAHMPARYLAALQALPTGLSTM